MSPKRSKKVISYDNLLEIVAKKEYGSLIKSELEEYLSDAEFKHCFEMDRVSGDKRCSIISFDCLLSGFHRRCFVAFLTGENKQ